MIERKNKWVPRLLIGLTVAFLALFLVVPLLFVLYQAFSKGLGVYFEAITDTYAVQALVLTLVTVLIAVAVNTIFGLFAAWSLTRYRFFGRKILNTFIDLPLSVSPVIAGLIFLLAFGRASPIYPLLTDLGIRVVYAVPGIVLATIFVTFPYVSREIIPVLEARGGEMCLDPGRLLAGAYIERDPLGDRRLIALILRDFAALSGLRRAGAGEREKARALRQEITRLITLREEWRHANGT